MLRNSNAQFFIFLFLWHQGLSLFDAQLSYPIVEGNIEEWKTTATLMTFTPHHSQSPPPDIRRWPAGRARFLRAWWAAWKHRSSLCLRCGRKSWARSGGTDRSRCTANRCKIFRERYRCICLQRWPRGLRLHFFFQAQNSTMPAANQASGVGRRAKQGRKWACDRKI